MHKILNTEQKMPTQFICLEKINSKTQVTSDPSLELLIVSARSSDFPVNPKIRTILIVHTEMKTCEAYDCYENTRNILKTETFENGNIIHWPENINKEISSQFTLHTLQKEYCIPSSWGEKFTHTGKHLLSIPAYGLINKHWYDGWMTHFSPNGDVLSLIPPGTQSRLYIPIHSVQTGGLTWKEACAELPSFDELQHHCVLDALKEQIRKEDLNTIYIKNFNLLTACKLLLLRQVFPEQDIEILHNSQKKEWPARFKNFLESIRATWKQGEEKNEIEFIGFSDENILNLAPLLNQKTKILEGIKR